MKLLEVNGLSYTYPDGHKVLENVSFVIEKGDFAAIVGRNGGGKTTLLKIILGLLDIPKEQYKAHIKLYTKRVSYVPQELDIPKNLPVTGFEIARSGFMLKAKLKEKLFYKKEEEQIILDIAKELNILELLDKQYYMLSGGQKQKILILRALVSMPKLLILDEATANMDKVSENQILKYIKNLTPQPTVLMVSHNVNTVSKYINKVICINKVATTHSIRPIEGTDINIVIHDNCGVNYGYDT